MTNEPKYSIGDIVGYKNISKVEAFAFDKKKDEWEYLIIDETTGERFWVLESVLIADRPDDSTFRLGEEVECLHGRGVIDARHGKVDGVCRIHLENGGRIWLWEHEIKRCSSTSEATTSHESVSVSREAVWVPKAGDVVEWKNREDDDDDTIREYGHIVSRPRN